MFSPWTFPRFVCGSGEQKLNPVLKPVLGKDKHDLVELFLPDLSLLRGAPESLFQLLAGFHVVIQVSPDHQRRIPAHREATSQFGWHSCNQVTPATTSHTPDQLHYAVECRTLLHEEVGQVLTVGTGLVKIIEYAHQLL